MGDIEPISILIASCPQNIESFGCIGVCVDVDDRHRVTPNYKTGLTRLTQAQLTALSTTLRYQSLVSSCGFTTDVECAFRPRRDT